MIQREGTNKTTKQHTTQKAYKMNLMKNKNPKDSSRDAIRDAVPNVPMLHRLEVKRTPVSNGENSAPLVHGGRKTVIAAAWGIAPAAVFVACIIYAILTK